MIQEKIWSSLHTVGICFGPGLIGECTVAETEVFTEESKEKRETHRCGGAILTGFLELVSEDSPCGGY